MATQIKLRRDTYQNWYDVNPVLADGEPGYDLTNKKLKIGDGTTLWRSLPYFDDQQTDLTSVAQDIIPSEDLTYNLGSPAKKWHSLYVGQGSIYVGDAVISLENGKLQSSVGFAGSLTTTRSSTGVTGFTETISPVLTKDGNDVYVPINGASSLTLTKALEPGYDTVYISYTLADLTTTTITQGITINGTALTLASPLPSNLLDGVSVYVIATYIGSYSFPTGQLGPYANGLTITESGDFDQHVPATYSYTLDQNGYLESITIDTPGSDYGTAEDNRIITISPTAPETELINLTGMYGNIVDANNSSWVAGTHTATGSFGGSTISVNYTVSEFDTPPQFANRYVRLNSFTSSTLLDAGTTSVFTGLYVSRDNPTLLSSTQTNADDVYISFVSNLAGSQLGYTVATVQATSEFNGNYTDLVGAPSIPTDVADLTDNSNLLGGGGATYDQSLNTTDSVTFNEINSTALWQDSVKTVSPVRALVPGATPTVVFTAPNWFTSFKLVIAVEGRLDGDVDNVDHTQTCEATIAATYNTTAEPIMSVYGIVYTSPTPLATFTVARNGNNIEVTAVNSQTTNNLDVRVQAIQFVSRYE